MRMSESNIGKLLAVTIQPLEGSLIVEMSIEHYAALREFKWCDAARYETHGVGKE
jgi:hypothetical protein